MLVNKKTVRKNKAMRRIQRDDKCANRDRAIERGSVLKRNIGKIVELSSENPVGEPCAECKLTPVNMDVEKLLSLLDEACLTGNSGNGFSTAEKIRTFLSADAKKKYIVINGAECEPGLLNDTWLMRNRMTEICFGAKILAQTLSPDRMILATRGAAEYKIEEGGALLELIKLPYQYPMGEEHILISQVLGRETEHDEILAEKGIPAEKGILVLNVQTVFQIGRIAANNYDGGHYVTLANLKTGEGRVAYVHTYTNIEGLLEKTFGEKGGACYFGGGVTHAEKTNENTTFTNTTSFAAIADETAIQNESPCKKCGGCTNKCPMGVSVKEIVLARQNNPCADISGFHAERCMHCGTCAYFCPAGKNPLEYILNSSNRN